ncbi:hypothetical protein [Psychromonas aquimarina]|uniref:hypothetical protein n=1 Tax=Psychromonas aquimarina TaxID=444919 RepID=UPI0003F83530|nr:hypothetical protein [Psychromonas aquimarina]
MKITSVLLLTALCGLLTACEAEKKQQQIIIPQAQLDALDKAKDLEKDLLKLQEQKDKQLKEQGL